MNILKPIDDFLNKITMYRLTLYSVIFLWLAGFTFSFMGLMPYDPIAMIESVVLIFGVCFITNELLAKLFKAPTNRESVYITAFILAALISPVEIFSFSSGVYFLVLSSILAMASKYILAIHKKHLFNPAATGVALGAFFISSQSAIWWMGTLYMAPFVLIVGLLICRKIKRFDLFLSFILASLAFTIGYGISQGQTFLSALNAIVIDSPMLYLGSIMLTEPMTTPPTRSKRMVYGVLVGFLNAPFINIAGFYFTPEIALLCGNVYAYIVSSKEKLVLKLKEKVKTANDTYDFIFNTNRKLKFEAGQYLEWTLAHAKNDDRGIRRYFTIASAPTEEEIIMGVKFYDKPSTYKQSLISLKEGGTVVASQLAGDFILPKNKDKKLVFIAGGIGVTPFRSMVKYLMDKNEKRDVVIFYSNKSFADIAYKNIFDEAMQKLGIKTVYCLNDASDAPESWNGETGFVTKEMIEKYVPDFKERMFYISGPRAMILTFDKALKEAGIHKSHIKTDFFPGFA